MYILYCIANFLLSTFFMENFLSHNVYNNNCKYTVEGNMKIEKIVNDFLLEVKLRHSIGTWRFYRSHLRHFINYAASISLSDLSDVDDSVIVDYVAHMKMTCENITINKRIGCLKMMYKQMRIDFPYLQSIDKFKVRQKTFDMVSEMDLKRIRSYMKNLSDGVGNNLYYKCLVLLMMDTGARIQEILFIEKKHVNLKDGEILLTHTKTKEDRTVFISDAAAHELRKIMMIDSKHPYVLHNITKNRPGTYNDVIWWMKHLRDVFNLKTLHAHMFRHSMASIWLQNGADIRSVMEVLGHKNLETTQRYLHVSREHAKNMFRKNYNLD